MNLIHLCCENNCASRQMLVIFVKIFYMETNTPQFKPFKKKEIDTKFSTKLLDSLTKYGSSQSWLAAKTGIRAGKISRVLGGYTEFTYEEKIMIVACLKEYFNIQF